MHECRCRPEQKPVLYFVTVITCFDLFIVNIFPPENVHDSVAVGTIVSKQLRSDDNKNRVYQT